MKSVFAESVLAEPAVTSSTRYGGISLSQAGISVWNVFF